MYNFWEIINLNPNLNANPNLNLNGNGNGNANLNHNLNPNANPNANPNVNPNIKDGGIFYLQKLEGIWEGGEGVFWGWFIWVNSMD